MSFRLLDERDINAIKGNLKGSVVRADDVLPAEHKMDVKVKSKNLFDMSLIKSDENLTNNGNGTVTVVANAYGVSSGKKLCELCPAIEVGKTYTLTATTQSALSKYIYLTVAGFTWNFGTARVMTKEMFESGVNIYGMHSSEADFGKECIVSNIQIEEGETPTEYTPYVDPASVTVTRCGKNLLKLSGTKSQNGVSLTMDEDGIYTISGTTTASINLNVGNAFVKAGRKYKPTVFIHSGSASPSFWNFTKEENMHKDSKGYISSDVDTEISAFIYASEAGVTYDGKFSVMLELVENDDNGEYEQYKGETYTPSEDGSCDVKTVAPTMTLFTDKEGAIIECEYNKDANKVIEKLTNAIIALGGTV